MYFLQLFHWLSTMSEKTPCCTPSSAPTVKPSFSRKSPITSRVSMGASALDTHRAPPCSDDSRGCQRPVHVQVVPKCRRGGEVAAKGGAAQYPTTNAKSKHGSPSAAPAVLH